MKKRVAQQSFEFDSPVRDMIELQRQGNALNSAIADTIELTPRPHRHRFTVKAEHDWGHPHGVRRVWKCEYPGCPEIKGRV